MIWLQIVGIVYGAAVTGLNVSKRRYGQAAFTALLTLAIIGVA